MKWVGGINDMFGGWNDIIIIRRVAVYSVTFDSSITRSIGGVVDFRSARSGPGTPDGLDRRPEQ